MFMHIVFEAGIFLPHSRVHQSGWHYFISGVSSLSSVKCGASDLVFLHSAGSQPVVAMLWGCLSDILHIGYLH